MPWEAKTVKEKRIEFVQAVEAHQESVSALCRRYGISRKTGYKWLNRARDGHPLSDESRRPDRQPSKTSPEVEQVILEMRRSNPAWGGKKIRDALESAGLEGLPSARTCGNILKRNGCIDPLESLKHKPCQRFEREECNQLWQMDFKGAFPLADGSDCFSFDVLDDHSRFCLSSEAKPDTKGTKSSLLKLFREYGLPDAILSDNGAQFAGFGGGYAQVERMLMDLDIEPIHGRIKHPQTQGKIERFHRTMKAEALRQMPKDLADARRVLEEFRFRYNELRPHCALGGKTPAAVYRPSQRQLPEKIEPFDYPADARMTKINSWGYLRFGPVQLYLSETMKDTYLEVRPSENDTFLLIYRNFKIAAVDAKEGKLLNRRIRRL